MARFTVYFGRKAVGIYDFGPGRFRVGRHPDSAVFLPNQSISRLHAVLQMREGEWQVYDTGGSNGLFVNGTKVTAHKLRTGDRVELGKYIIHFAAGEGDEGTTAEADEIERLLNPGSSRAPEAMPRPDELFLGPKPTGLEVHDATVRMTMEQVLAQRREAAKIVSAHIAWIDEDGRKVMTPLREPAIIGSGDGAKVNLPTRLLTAPEHARVFESGGRYYVEPLRWWGTVRVNGVRVKGRAALSDSDCIQIARTTVVFRDALLGAPPELPR